MNELEADCGGKHDGTQAAAAVAAMDGALSPTAAADTPACFVDTTVAPTAPLHTSASSDFDQSAPATPMPTPTPALSPTLSPTLSPSTSFTADPILHRRTKSNPMAALPTLELELELEEASRCDSDAASDTAASAADEDDVTTEPQSGTKTESNSSSSSACSSPTNANRRLHSLHPQRTSPSPPPPSLSLSPRTLQHLHALVIETDFSASSPPKLPTQSPLRQPIRTPAASPTRLRPSTITTASSSQDALASFSSPTLPTRKPTPSPLLSSTTTTTTTTTTTNHPPPPHPFRLADFFYKEIFGVHDIKPTDAMHQARVQNFLVVPLKIEQLFLFGVFLALDSFLYVFTYLPLRILFATGCAVTSSFHTRVFRRTHFYDLMVAVIVGVATSVLWRVDMSRVYHAIRGQAMIKLYVIFTMIEIFDRLFSSLGQDILDSLYFTAKYQPRRVSRMFLDFVVAIIYVVLHSLLLFAQVVTINVAINSSNTSLLTLLISNNFGELKTSVFKKFEEQNLFQIACSDIVERFKLLLIVGLILLQSSAKDVAYGTAMVMLAEMLIDWLKHAFITKFNQIPPSVYSKFTTILCRDLTGWKNEDTILDHTHHVSRRLGLVSLPLACVVLRMVLKALGDAPFALTTLSGACMAIAFFLCLAAFKALLSLVLMIYACRSGRLDDTRPKSPRAVSHHESIQRYRF